MQENNIVAILEFGSLEDIIGPSSSSLVGCKTAIITVLGGGFEGGGEQFEHNYLLRHGATMVTSAINVFFLGCEYKGILIENRSSRRYGKFLRKNELIIFMIKYCRFFKCNYLH